MQYIVIYLFIGILITCVLTQTSLVLALSLGYGLFFTYGLYKKCSGQELLAASWHRVRSIGPLLFIFMLIGSLTASWRASGTIAYIIENAAHFINPTYFVLLTFLLCSAISLLMGTAFGASATVGVICMTIGNLLAIDPAYLGGAILSGCFLGDRMSPVSSVMLLVAMITRTDPYITLKRMYKSVWLPLLLTCAVYIYLGQELPPHTASLAILDIFRDNFSLNALTLLPAAFIVILACLRISIHLLMLASIGAACAVCFFLQNMSLLDICATLLWGFESHDARLGALMNGGGITSMINVALIVGISTSFVGIFEITQLLQSLRQKVLFLTHKVGAFAAMVVTSCITCAIACNQTMSIIITADLCKENYTQTEDMAIPLEDSALIIAPLIPWSITCTVPLVSIGAPTSSIVYATFLYSIPLIGLIKSRTPA